MPTPPAAAVVFVNPDGVAPEVIDWSLPMAPGVNAGLTVISTGVEFTVVLPAVAALR